MRDKVYNAVLLISSTGILLLLAGILYTLFSRSLPAFERFGFLDFICSSEWDTTPGMEKYGIRNFISCTFITAALALLFSIPFTLSLILYTEELYKERKLSKWISSVINFSTYIPSIVLGVWGYYMIRPLFHSLNIGHQGFGILTASVVLAIMIIPYATKLCATMVSRIPQTIREEAISLGGTKLEVARVIILGIVRKGLLGAHFLALGKALGETIIVSILIGNTMNAPSGITDSGNTMTSLIMNQIGGISDLKISALAAIAFLLFMITMIVNTIGRVLIKRES